MKIQRLNRRVFNRRNDRTRCRQGRAPARPSPHFSMLLFTACSAYALLCLQRGGSFQIGSTFAQVGTFL